MCRPHTVGRIFSLPVAGCSEEEHKQKHQKLRDKDCNRKAYASVHGNKIFFPKQTADLRAVTNEHIAKQK